MSIPSGRKWHNSVFMVNGERWDSRLEYQRWLYLSKLEERGDIRNLRRQVTYTLTPKSYRTVQRTGKNGKLLTPSRRLHDRECCYRADFVFEFYDDISGQWLQVVEDTKGQLTKEYLIKRKLMLYFFGIVISEVRTPCAPVEYIDGVEIEHIHAVQ